MAEIPTNPLLEAVKKWGDWVLEEARKELAQFYPPDPDGSIPVGYIWARTIPCQNPGCGAEIPLMRQFWLAKKAKKKVALYFQTLRVSKTLRVSIVGDGYDPWPEGFDPSQGTVSRAVATCPVCGGVVEAKTTRRLFREGKAGQRMVAVVLKHPQRRGKTYRVATAEDVRVFRETEAALREKRERLMLEWGLDPVPDEMLPIERVRGFSGFRVLLYGMKKWGDLFNARQKLALITFADKVRQVHTRMMTGVTEPEFAKAVATYLGLGVDRLASFSSTLSWWQSKGGFVVNLFGRQALPMVWDYFEVNPSSGATGDWNSAVEWVTRAVEHCVITATTSPRSVVQQGTATQLPYPDAYFDAILTDPPYYDNVAYADLADFFYIWLKRSVGYLYPELFSTPLTPKSNEMSVAKNCRSKHHATSLSTMVSDGGGTAE